MSKFKTVLVKISSIKPNENNPRIIKDDKFQSLVKSVTDFPEMLEIRPIVINEDGIIIGGNMRYRACLDAGIKEVPVIKLVGMSQEKQNEFLIKDNVSGGEWDWDALANNWAAEDLKDCGLSVWQTNSDFTPEYNPIISDNKVTEEQIEARAKVLAAQMAKESQNQEVICPNCEHAFEVQL